MEPMDTSPDDAAVEGDNDEGESRLDKLAKETCLATPVDRLIVNEQRQDRVQFLWQSDEMSTENTFRPVYESIMAYSADAIFKDKIHNLWASFPVLPMMVYNSPVMAMMEHTPRQPWVPRWQTSLQSLWNLTATRLYILLVYGETQIKRTDVERGRAFDQVTKNYEQRFDKLNEWLFLGLQTHVYRYMVQHRIKTFCEDDPNVKEVLDRFVRYLTEYTYRLLHLNELIIYQYIRIASPPKSPFHKRPYCTLLTPRPTNDEPLYIRDCMTANMVAKAVKHMESFFQTKQSWRITKTLSHGGRDDDVRVHIYHDRIVAQWQKGPNYPGGLMPYRLLWDYCAFLDDQGILASANIGLGDPYDPVKLKELKSILRDQNYQKQLAQKQGFQPGRFTMAPQ